MIGQRYAAEFKDEAFDDVVDRLGVAQNSI